MEICDAAEKQARALQPVGQPVGHLQAGRVQAGGGLGENPSALEDMMQVEMQLISIFAKSSKSAMLLITSVKFPGQGKKLEIRESSQYN